VSRRPVVALDADGVILDYAGRVFETLRNRFGIRVPESEQDDWRIEDHPAVAPVKEELRRIQRSMGWCSQIRPLPGAREFVRELRTIAEVVCVTAPFWRSDEGPHSTWAAERACALAAEFDFDRGSIISTHAKEHIAADVLVDDLPENLLRWWERRLVPGLLWSTTANKDVVVVDELGAFRVRSYGEILDYVRRLPRRRR
jgi:5'(3')-deoxyribonucleotidase